MLIWKDEQVAMACANVTWVKENILVLSLASNQQQSFSSFFFVPKFHFSSAFILHIQKKSSDFWNIYWLIKLSIGEDQHKRHNQTFDYGWSKVPLHRWSITRDNSTGFNMEARFSHGSCIWCWRKFRSQTKASKVCMLINEMITIADKMKPDIQRWPLDQSA